MAEIKEIGVIEAARFGWGGYGDSQVGLSVTLKMGAYGTQMFDGAWGIKHSEHCKWTEAERITQLGEVAMRLAKILSDAKKTDVSQLVGVPVEVTTDGNMVKSWRVLTEVIL